MTDRPQKRLPGQSNAEYEPKDPNAAFLDVQAFSGGGGSTLYRAVRAFWFWVGRRRGGGGT